MAVIGKIERKPNAKYIINRLGEIMEITENINTVKKIELNPAKRYHILSDGSIIEREVVFVTMEKFYKMKESGELAQLYRDDKEVDIKEENLSLKEMEKIEEEHLKKSIEGAIISSLKSEVDLQGNRILTLFLSNGKTIKLKEGLLARSCSIEIE